MSDLYKGWYYKTDSKKDVFIPLHPLVGCSGGLGRALTSQKGTRKKPAVLNVGKFRHVA